MDIENSFWQLPGYSGADLEKLLNECEKPWKPLIDGLIYEKTATMFYADDGVGKSLLLMQMICEASAGLKVFDYFETPKPMKTLWVQGERNIREIGGRIRKFKTVFEPNLNNIIVTDKLQGFDLKKEAHQDKAIAHIDKLVMTYGSIDCVVIDPIYSLVTGEITSDEAANYITRFSTMLQNHFLCATVFVHHTNRGQKNESGDRVGMDFHGSRFLSAHFSGNYHIQNRTDSIMGRVFERTKDSNEFLIRRFALEYDPETKVSTIDSSSVTKKENVIQWLRNKCRDAKFYTLAEIQSEFNINDSYLDRIRKEYPKGFVKTEEKKGRKNLYKSELT